MNKHGIHTIERDDVVLARILNEYTDKGFKVVSIFPTITKDFIEVYKIVWLEKENKNE